MKILQRYIVSELLLPFILCVVTLNFIFMAGYMVKAAHFIIGRGVPLTDTLYVLLLALPQMASYTIPTSILTAILIVFGNLSQNNELRAMKASGVHLLHIVLPVLLIGIILSFGMFVFNDQIANNAGFELRKVTKQMVLKNPKAVIEPGRFVKLSESIIFMTKRMENDEMRDVIAYEIEESDKPVRTIMAERGEIVIKPGSSDVQVILYDGSISDSQDEGVHAMQFKTYVFPTLGQEDIQKMRKKTRELTLAEILFELGVPDATDQDKRELWTAFHQRISFSFGSFIFVFIGVPIAVLVRRGEIVVSFGIAMASVSLYYILFAGAKSLSVQGVMPPLIANWFPNLLLFMGGFYLLRRSLVS